MESCPEDTDRAPVAVERRVGEELVVERQATARSDGKIIIRFQRLLAGVAQVAVAVKNARAARLQEGLLVGRSTDQITEKTEGVAGTVPCGAFDARRYWGSPAFLERNEPGMDEKVTLLFAERGVRAVGSDMIGCEIPMVKGVSGESPGHRRHWLPNGILIVECLAQLEKLPLRSFLIAAPLPIQNGSGSPLRPIAYF